MAMWAAAILSIPISNAFSVSTRPFLFAPTISLRAPRSSQLQMNVENIQQKDVIKVGVIGMGRIGLVHLEAITKAPGVVPVIVSNPTVSKAEAGTFSDTSSTPVSRT
jgi:hypothetical protein